MEAAIIVVVIGALIFLAHFFSETYPRTRIPDVLLLFLIGLLLGPCFNLITPAHFGAVGPIFTTVTLVLILFESGIRLGIDPLRKTLRNFLTLTCVNFLVTMLTVGSLLWLFSDLGPDRSFMLGAILGGTSSAVVIPLVARLRMQTESSTILILESAISDILCIVFALSFMEAYRLQTLNLGLMIGKIVSSIFLAVIIGIAGAFVWSFILNRIRNIQNSMFTTFAFVFVIFGLVELLGYSGAIASLAFGITIANILWLKEILSQFKPMQRFLPENPVTLSETEKQFFGEVVFLFKTFFFVYIGLSIRLTNPLWLFFGLALTLVIFILRLPIVRFSINKSIPTEDLALMAVITPKGLAAAVLASIPLQQGIPGGDFIQNVTYSVILFSIIATSVLTLLLEKTKLTMTYQRLLTLTATSFGLTKGRILKQTKAEQASTKSNDN